MKEEIKAGKANWRTTTFGVGSQIMIIGNELLKLVDESTETLPDWNIVIAAIGAAVAFFMSRDGRVSSATSGAE